MPHPLIKSASDLQTSHEATIDGFIAQAAQKDQLATPYVEEARKLADELHQLDSIASAAGSLTIVKHLTTAAGLSDKAQNYLTDKEREAAIRRLLNRMVADENWREEVVYRYLLIRGATLDGSMRNLTGASACDKLSDAIRGALAKKGIEPEAKYAKKGKVKELRWRRRVLVFDRKPKFVGNGVDAILLKATADEKVSSLIENQDAFLACGELKGGIDPAGADEHWKTASSAFTRLRQIFNGEISYFYVGAAIERRMAEEIFAQMANGKLTNAANLTKPSQLFHLATWLVSL